MRGRRRLFGRLAPVLVGVALVAGACDAGPLLFPPPASLELEGAAGLVPPILSGEVGVPVDPAPRLRVLDADGNPVPGARVRLEVLEGGGVLEGGAERVSDRQGRVALEGWRLGEVAAPNVIRGVLQIGGVDAPPGRGRQLEVRVQGRAGAPHTLTWERDPDIPLSFLAGTVVTDLPTVQATDRFGNPVGQAEVRFAVTQGSGAVSNDRGFTDADGRARVFAWTLGPETGPQALLARVEGVPTATDTLEVQALQVAIEAVHLNQGNQTLEGTVPVVAGRPGLLRAFLRAGEHAPGGVQVRFRIRQGETILLDSSVQRGDGGGIPSLAPDPDILDRSWNLPVPGSVVVPGAELQVRVEFEGTPGGAPGAVLSWPASGGWAPLNPRIVPPFRATFIPIHATWFGLTGRITPENGPDYWTETLDAFPVTAYDFQVRTEPLVYDGSFANGSSGWSGALQDIRDLRLLEGAFDRYYHGILQRPGGAGIAGIAYVATNPTGISNLAAVSFDAFPLAPPVIAHEFGHNFGRPHSPCGNVTGVDPDYPHAGGRIGGTGWAAFSGGLRPTSDFRDVMSYCFPLWVSDYTFTRILGMREARPVGDAVPWAAARLPGAPGSPRETLLVGGGWSASEGVFLRPAIGVHAVPTPPLSRGDATLELLDAEGRILARHTLQGAPVDHADDPTLRHVAAVIPVPDDAEAVTTLRLVTPEGTTLLEGRPASRDPGGQGAPGDAPAPAPPVAPVAGAVRVGAALAGPGLAGPEVDGLVRVERVQAPLVGPGLAAAAGTTGEAVRIRWDTDRWPVLVLRDGPGGLVVAGSDRGDDAGRIRGFLRSGDAVVPIAPGVHTLSLALSDGVRTLRLETVIR